jgi:hypothetical protein
MTDETERLDAGAVDLLRRIRTEGVELAYETAINICRDPKAPAPAKATAVTTLFRVAGYFGKTDGDENKQPHEMSAEEIEARIRRLQQRRQSGSSVFD